MLLLIGGPARVGKSALGERILQAHSIPWISTDIIRTVLERIQPEITTADRSNGPDALARVMLPHLKTLITVCLAVHPQYLIEGAELTPDTVLKLKEATAAPLRACFIVHTTFTANDLVEYRGRTPWHKNEMRPDRYESFAARIRAYSLAIQRQLAQTTEDFWTCIDVSQDFEAALDQAQRFLLQD